jgi:hypothetical protein
VTKTPKSRKSGDLRAIESGEFANTFNLMRVYKGLGKTRPKAIRGLVDTKLEPAEIQTDMFILKQSLSM